MAADILAAIERLMKSPEGIAALRHAHAWMEKGIRLPDAKSYVAMLAIWEMDWHRSAEAKKVIQFYLDVIDKNPRAIVGPLHTAIPVPGPDEPKEGTHQ